MEKVIKALEMARIAHKDQMYGQSDYVSHLHLVAGMVAKHGVRAMILAYLHDIVEDTTTTLKDIGREFGPDIAEGVRLLTDSGGKNRKERKEKTNRKLSKTSDKDVLYVKTADRFINVSVSFLHHRSKLLKMYKKEYPDFKKAVYREELSDNLWETMDKILLD